MKTLIKESVSKIKLSDESKKRILTDIKTKSSHKTKSKSIIRYVSSAAVFCLLFSSALCAALYFYKENKPDTANNIIENYENITDNTINEPEKGNISSYSNNSFSKNNNITGSQENQSHNTSDISKYPSSNSETSVSEYFQQSTAIPVSQSSENTETQTEESTDDNPYDIADDGIYEYNGIYLDGSVYSQIMKNNTKTLYDFTVMPYYEELKQFVYNGKTFTEISDEHMNNIMLYDNLCLVKDILNNNSSDEISGNSSTAFDPLQNNNDDIKKLAEKYKNDLKQLETDINNAKNNISISNETVLAAENEYYRQFAEKAQEEFTRCGLLAEITDNYCHVYATADDIISLKIENKDLYYLTVIPQISYENNNTDTYTGEFYE